MNAFIASVLVSIGSSLPFLASLAAAEADQNAVTAQSIVQDLKYPNVKASHLLAFSAQVDDRPLFVEKALLAVEFTTNTWQLLNVYRHPKESRDHWSLSRIYDAPQYVGSRNFQQRPTEAEVEKFLRDTWWKFGPSQGFRLLRGEVYSETWKNTLGYQPKHEYPKSPD